MIDDDMRLAAEERMRQTMQRSPKAVRVRYDRRRASIVIRLDSGMDLTVPARLVDQLVDASDDDLAQIEITPTGLGLHWPSLDADLYVPGLLGGSLDSRPQPAAAAG